MSDNDVIDMESALRREARAKRDDDRYPARLKDWMREKLIEVHGERLGEERARAILAEVWPTDDGGDEDANDENDVDDE